MSYIQSVYDRLPDDIIEIFDGSNLDIEVGGLGLLVNFITSSGAFCDIAFSVVLDGVVFYAQTSDCSPNVLFRADQLIAIGELVNAMNDIAHRDFMDALSESESCDE